MWYFSQSLSARRAWIEIKKAAVRLRAMTVALRKESVDRNTVAGGSYLECFCRSPQGERG